MCSVVAGAIAVGATFAVTRQTVRAQAVWQVGAGLLVLAVAFDRWILGAHYVSDIIGGALLGATVASGSLIASGVKVQAPYELVTELVRSKAVEPPGRAHAARRGDLQPDQGHRLGDLPPARGVRAEEPGLAARALAGDRHR